MQSYQASVANATVPFGSASPASNICAPPMPTRAIASKSAVIPSFVTLPFIQCHHVCGLADFGGERNSSGEISAENATPARHDKKTMNRFTI